MQTATPIGKALKRIVGKPCWHVEIGYATFLTFEFGKPHLEIREPVIANRKVSARVRDLLAHRRVYVRGEWHLWIYCCDWEVVCRRKRIGDSSTKRKATRAAQILDGLKVTGYRVSARTGRTIFSFENGTRLTTHPFDKTSEQWLLYEPSGKVLVVRADGRYWHGRSNDTSTREDAWRPITPATLQNR